jgi:hypothetical protein
MAYPKLKQVITLKKAQLEHTAMIKRRERFSHIIYGNRKNRSNLCACQLRYEEMVEIFILYSPTRCDEGLSMNLLITTFRAFKPPSRNKLLSISNVLNDEFKVVPADMMYDIFPDWGESWLDKWAIECNTSYTFVFTLHYNDHTMVTTQSIQVYGKPNIDLPTYIDNYTEAMTMNKLETNL